MLYGGIAPTHNASATYTYTPPQAKETLWWIREHAYVLVEPLLLRPSFTEIYDSEQQRRERSDRHRMGRKKRQ